MIRWRAPDDCEIAHAAAMCVEVVRLKGRIAQLDFELLALENELKKHGIIINFRTEFTARKRKFPPRTPLDET
jgi:hypothetical protein